MRKPFDKSISVDEMILGEFCSSCGGGIFSGKMGEGVVSGGLACVIQISDLSWRRASTERLLGGLELVGATDSFSGGGGANNNAVITVALDPSKIVVQRWLCALVVLILNSLGAFLL